MTKPNYRFVSVLALCLASTLSFTTATRAEHDKSVTTQEDKDHRDGQHKPLTAAKFTHKAAVAGMNEVKMARIASERAVNSEVRRFASRLALDHQEANERLASIARRNGYKLPDSTSARPSLDTSVDKSDGSNPALVKREKSEAVVVVTKPASPPADRQLGDAAAEKASGVQKEKTQITEVYVITCEQLETLNGTDFDRAFLKAMVSDHKEAISLFTRASQEVDDKEIKEFASSTLPKLREHLRDAERLSLQSTASR